MYKPNMDGVLLLDIECENRNGIKVYPCLIKKHGSKEMTFDVSILGKNDIPEGKTIDELIELIANDMVQYIRMKPNGGGQNNGFPLSNAIISKSMLHAIEERKKIMLKPDSPLQKASEVIAELEAKIDLSLAENKQVRLDRLSHASKIPKTINVASVAYIRNADVIVEVLDRAKGICEECNNKAPFVRKRDNTPYLEVHHRIPLSEGGFDTVENAIAVCPNCHRKLHYG